MHERIIILDFGGQYAHLIASRIRRQNVLAEIMMPGDAVPETLSDKKIKGIILSGGPQSVFSKDSLTCDPKILELGKPVLGICYGHQFLAHTLGGKVLPGEMGEFGRAEFAHNGECPLFKNVPEKSTVWMNHVDEVGELPKGFQNFGSTDHCKIAASWNPDENWFSVQFHLEVTHTEFGEKVLGNFLDICECSRDWTIEKFFEEHEQKIHEKVGDKNVFLFVSGGVDSTVAFAFLTKILGKNRVRGLFVDTGLMRKDEVSWVKKSLEGIGADLTVLYEADRFLDNLKDISDPEKKREIIGHTFLDVQHDFFTKHDLHDDWVLAQGTIYPDTIETGGTAHAAKIKTHHNRAPEVQKLIDAGKIVEPIAELYKDEVRRLGELLGLPHELVWRHPFPGPGLGVRILCSDQSSNYDLQSSNIEFGEVNPFTLSVKKKPYILLPIKSVGVQGDFRTYKHPGVLKIDSKDIEELEKMATKLINHYSEINRCVSLLGKNFNGEIAQISVKKCSIEKSRIETIQKADAIVMDLLHRSGEYKNVWQFPVVLLPVSFNGVGEESVVLRPVDSIDAMSAAVGKLSFELLEKMAEEILKDKNISAVFLDVTSKPPGTIEWE